MKVEAKNRLDALRVLVVDDEPTVPELVGLVLSHYGLRVDEAHDGREALRKATAASPDVVLLDVMMPRMDGLEVCRKIRSNPRLDGTAVVLCSAAEESSVDWRGAGADAFLQKPFNVSSLPQLMEDVSRAHV